MNQIEKLNFKGIGSLDASSFFHFLVKEGYRLSLITAGQLESLQQQIVLLLADRFNLRTGGQSCSVPVEMGRQIQQSAFYTVGYYLKSLPDAESALEALRDEPLADLFQKGLKLMDKNRKEAAEQLRFLQQNRLKTDVIAYNDTLEKGLPMFFTDYDPDFEAHETPASVDYPLGNDRMNLTGIDYVQTYMRKLRLENEFCRRFPDEEIRCLLRGYDRQYRELLFNIYNLVYTNAVGCLLLGRDGIDLRISDFDRQSLQRELTPLSADQLGSRVDAAVAGLCSMLDVADVSVGDVSAADVSITGARMTDYLRESAVGLKARLKHALETDGLHHLFLSLNGGEDVSALIFEDNAALDHDSFLALSDEIRECRLVSDKLVLLQREPLSMTDLIDLLEGDCFFGDEYQAAFESLEDIRLALLAKKLPLDPAGSGFLEEESGQEWQISLDAFLSQIEPGRKTALLSLAERIADGEEDSLH